jgi:hypothetical protein
VKGLTGRAPKLTADQADEVRRRYRLFRENTPTRIAADIGTSTGHVHHLVRQELKHHIVERRKRA